MLGANVGVETEGHFELVDWLSGEAGGENLMQTFEGVMAALEAGDALLDREARFHGIGHGAKPGKGGQMSVRLIGIHRRMSGGKKSSRPVLGWNSTIMCHFLAMANVQKIEA